ncbi:hypothetical protein Godav_005329, partial [Gossypium davidsonii]|nr:hypothetical protein [Gossypium davidsonii]MBA0669575.1 hypothetical protein [Gossypium klotzschianum]
MDVFWPCFWVQWVREMLQTLNCRPLRMVWRSLQIRVGLGVNTFSLSLSPCFLFL